jgi:hypothetical protein
VKTCAAQARAASFTLNARSSSLHGLVKLQIPSPVFLAISVLPYAHAAPLPVFNVCHIELHRWTGLPYLAAACRNPLINHIPPHRQALAMTS